MSGKRHEPGGCLQRRHFVVVEGAITTLLETPELHRADARAAQVQHRVPDRRQRAPQLALPSLTDNHPQAGYSSGIEDLDLGRPRRALFENNTLT
jgi:hypothetical protein